LRVVGTIPDRATLAEELGGDRVDARSLSRGTENLHMVQVRPSMLIALNRAELYLQMGLSMEAVWITDLLIRAKNPRIASGSEGFENCSEGWEAIQVPRDLSRKGGDLHPQGNPHFNLDPLGGPHLAAKVHEALVRVDPAGKELYDRNLAAWRKRLAEKQERWEKIRKALAGKKIVVYHMEYNYFARRAGMEVVASIEPKPGIPPSPGDVTRVVELMEETGAEVIVTAAWSNNRQTADIARRTGAKVVELPNQVGGASWAMDWISLMDGIHERMAEAFELELE
jgi:ABC-type Zn uptake system ZnuABC Zn-binding protein ZnuA